VTGPGSSQPRWCRPSWPTWASWWSGFVLGAARSNCFAHTGGTRLRHQKPNPPTVFNLRSAAPGCFAGRLPSLRQPSMALPCPRLAPTPNQPAPDLNHERITRQPGAGWPSVRSVRRATAARHAGRKFGSAPYVAGSEELLSGAIWHVRWGRWQISNRGRRRSWVSANIEAEVGPPRAAGRYLLPQ